MFKRVFVNIIFIIVEPFIYGLAIASLAWVISFSIGGAMAIPFWYMTGGMSLIMVLLEGFKSMWDKNIEIFDKVDNEKEGMNL